jgi:hypothetical protein
MIMSAESETSAIGTLADRQKHAKKRPKTRKKRQNQAKKRKNYEEFDCFSCKTSPIHRPSAGNPKHEVLNPKQVDLKEYNLKKQSQFRPK